MPSPRLFRIPALAAIGFAPLVAALSLAAPEPAEAQPRAAGVIVDEVTIGQIAETTPIIGRFVAAVEAEVAARASGVVDAVAIEVGDRISRGAVIAELDGTLPRIAREQAAAMLSRAEAEIAEAEARLTLARQALARAESLQGSNAFSRGAFEDRQQEVAAAESELASAVADRIGAEADIARADYDVTHARIVAPFDGVVLARRAQPGEYLAVGAPVATLLDLENLEIELDTPAELINGLTPGMTVEAVSRGFGEEARFEAVVRAVIPREDEATRTRPVRFSVDSEAKAALSAAPGGSVTVLTPSSAPRSVLTAPKDALVQSRGGWIVYLVEAGDTGLSAAPRPVEIGAAFGGRIEILSGLAPGDLVVIRGNERLRPGQPIAPRRADGVPVAVEDLTGAAPADPASPGEETRVDAAASRG